MGDASWLEIPEGRRIAYHRTEGEGPGVVFLGGFASDMEGTKAVHLEAWARARGRAFLRFDYSGHGQSSGAFTNGSIGAWAADAKAAITTLTEGPQVLVGSSMGGWIALLMARKDPRTHPRARGHRRRPRLHRGQHVGGLHRGPEGHAPRRRPGHAPFGLRGRRLHHHPPPDRGRPQEPRPPRALSPSRSPPASCKAPPTPTSRPTSPSASSPMPRAPTSA